MTAYCSNCGAVLPPASRFCSACGTVVAGAPPAGYQSGYQPGYNAPYSYPTTRLVRPIYGRQFAGVCAAFARTYDWDLGLVRILTVVSGIFLFPITEVVYLACWIGIPEELVELPPPPQP
jgi:phage shock protein PspC (stress-responsive transcriptional regulator)